MNFKEKNPPQEVPETGSVMQYQQPFYSLNARIINS